MISLNAVGIGKMLIIEKADENINTEHAITHGIIISKLDEDRMSRMSSNLNEISLAVEILMECK